MNKYLVIVESPAKAKTINKYLGEDYKVLSSVGHVRDLISSATKKFVKQKIDKNLPKEKIAQLKKKNEKEELINRIGVEPENNWHAHYQIIKGKEKVVKELKQAAKNVDTVYLATDLDREGEAIAWHLEEILKKDVKNFKRVVFNQITKKAIDAAFLEPTDVDQNKVNAQQARRFLDRIVGFMVSPLLWRKIARGLSAGRVQSVALKMVVEKEKKIKEFIPKEYWNINVQTKTNKQKPSDLTLELTKEDEKNITIENQEKAKFIEKKLQQNKFIISKVQAKQTSTKPPAPFITSSLQQSANSLLGFGVKRTMIVAQKLYEAGFITYMRTDSYTMSFDAIEQARSYIKQNFDAKYLPEKPNIYTTKRNSQDAHEAIRPTNFINNDLGHDKDTKALYKLIWQRATASQMTPALYNTLTIKVSNQNYELSAKAKSLVFAGFTKIMPKKQNQENILPKNIKENDEVFLDKINLKQNFTRPTPRYSEASLVKELEKKEIGRPSTYASIISTIVDRGYVSVQNRRFMANKMGEVVSDRLNNSFESLMNYDFTASLEESLDKIAKGDDNYKNVLNKFYKDFQETLKKASKPADEGGMRTNEQIITPIKCPKCNRDMLLKNSQTGTFLGCSGFNLKDNEKCATILSLIPFDAISDNEEQEALAIKNKKRCKKCSSYLDPFFLDKNRKLHICANTPLCDYLELEEGEFISTQANNEQIDCDKCSDKMTLKVGRFGKYFACDSETCSNTRKVLKDGKAAPPREDPVAMPDLLCTKSNSYFVLRDGAAGIFLAAHDFPKSRETRPPKIMELKKYKSKLPKKFLYFTKAPDFDPLGNPTIVRFSRKTKSQYVGSIKDNKTTKWSLFYTDDKWQEIKKEK